FFLHSFPTRRSSDLDFFYSLRFVELRILIQHSYGIAEVRNHLTLVFFVSASNYPQQRRFARAIQAKHSNFGPIKKREVYVFENLDRKSTRLNSSHEW